MTTLEYLEKHKDQFLEELKELLRIPSISAQQEHASDMCRCVEFLKAHLQEIGLENCAIMETEGHPVVYADYLKALGKPTVLIYGHYDVQAPDPLNEWKSDPFDPQIRDGNIYGRGTADDKGQFFTHFKAIEALIRTGGSLPVNIKILIEGEEEIGGIHLPKFIAEHKELLKADICVISDSNALTSTQPLIGYGLRGLVYTQLNLSALAKDVHSGSYGGNVPNVAIELANVIAKLKNLETQEVLIPGFYDNVRIISADEKEKLSKSPFTQEFILKNSGAKSLVGVEGFSIAERMGVRPTLDINGMSSGYLAEGAKTIIPARAMAKISMRLVPNQTAKEIEQKFVDYVKKITPSYLDLDIQVLSTGEPILMDISSNYFEEASKILKETFGNEPIYELGGGSIPVTADFKNLLNVDSILMGFGLPDDGLHSPNEKISLEMFYKGIKTCILFYEELSKA